MIFIADHFYQISYKYAAAVTFMAMDNNEAFHKKRVSIGDKQFFLYKLLTEDLESLEEIYMPITSANMIFSIEQRTNQLPAGSTNYEKRYRL